MRRRFAWSAGLGLVLAHVHLGAAVSAALGAAVSGAVAGAVALTVAVAAVVVRAVAADRRAGLRVPG